MNTIESSRSKIAPVISSSVAGPLGILHLPRLWLKIVLHACGRLPEGYRHGEGGFDTLLCDRLGIDRTALIAYIETELPEYSSVERWVLAHASDLSPLAVNSFNQTVRTMEMSAKTAAERRKRFAIADEESSNAIALNDLDDWAALHAVLISS